jgi:hypothetical protein
MFKRRTLFIVGAGASCEFGLPPGSGLAKVISEKMDIVSERYRSFDEDNGQVRTGDSDIVQSLRHIDARDINRFIGAAHIIRDGVQMSASIDDFLDVHSADENIRTVGKIAIAKTILEAERSSKLFFDRSNIFNKMNVTDFENTWIMKFVRMLGRNVPKQDVGGIFKNVAFICFNYDRCIEHCLYHALQQLYSIPGPHAGELLQTLDIIHPYGKVGELKTDAQQGIEFGGGAHGLRADYASLSRSIKTYTEQIDDTKELEEIQDQMVRADRIVFLGFAFHDQNMALLNPSGKLKRKEVYATAYQMSDNDVDVIRAQIVRFSAKLDREKLNDGNVVIRNDLKCADLFDQYTRSLPA